jgi:Asp-tRNA(Asn)/Glu-tRNA(Gln) amidotransferase A subunit family amidase
MKSWQKHFNSKAALDNFMTENQQTNTLLESSCSDAAQTFLARAKVLEPVLHAFTSIDAERLLTQARLLDELPVEQRGPLHGLLVGVKEVYDAEGYVCGWGTEIHANRRPTQDSAAVASLRAAGALVAGITVSTEYALAKTGPTTNPHDANRSPGASSQGSAAAVGAGLVPAALGSQTIGSIIRPAAYCGCVGFKPSRGLFDGRGSMPLSVVLDHVGFFASNAILARKIAAVLQPDYAWNDARLPSEVVLLKPSYTDRIDAPVNDAIERVARRLSASQTKVEKAVLPNWSGEAEEALIDTILAYDMAANHGGDFDRQGEKMSTRIRDYILRGRELTQASYQTALGERERMAKYLDKLLHGRVAVIAAATGVAPLRNNGTGSRAPQRLSTLLGLPSISVPVELHQGLPVGIQLVAARGSDKLVLNLAERLLEADEV